LRKFSKRQKFDRFLIAENFILLWVADVSDDGVDVEHLDVYVSETGKVNVFCVYKVELVFLCVVFAGLLRVGGDVGNYEWAELAGDVRIE
jgi:hypothetical protein